MYSTILVFPIATYESERSSSRLTVEAEFSASHPAEHLIHLPDLGAFHRGFCCRLQPHTILMLQNHVIFDWNFPMGVYGTLSYRVIVLFAGVDDPEMLKGLS